MELVFFEINHLHSLGFREMITKEKDILNIVLRVHLRHNIQQLKQTFQEGILDL